MARPRGSACCTAQCPDDYNSLSLKTRWLCLWAITNFMFDFLFKCDDDTYVHVDRLLKCDTHGDYVGCDIPGHDYPHASGGAGYRLSRNAAIHVATFLNGSASYEDWMVWKLLTNAGMPLRSIHVTVTIPNTRRRNTTTKSRVTGAANSECAVHEGLHPGNPVPPPPN